MKDKSSSAAGKAPAGTRKKGKKSSHAGDSGESQSAGDSDSGESAATPSVLRPKKDMSSSAAGKASAQRPKSRRVKFKNEINEKKATLPNQHPLSYKCKKLWTNGVLPPVRVQKQKPICAPFVSTGTSGSGRALFSKERCRVWAAQEIIDHAAKGVMDEMGNRMPVKDPDVFNGMYLSDALDYIKCHGVALEEHYPLLVDDGLEQLKRKDRDTFVPKGPRLFIKDYTYLNDLLVKEDDPEGPTKDKINYDMICAHIDERPLIGSIITTPEFECHSGEGVYLGKKEVKKSEESKGKKRKKVEGGEEKSEEESKVKKRKKVKTDEEKSPVVDENGVNPRLHYVAVVGYGEHPVDGDFYAIQNTEGPWFGVEGIGLVHHSQLFDFVSLSPPFVVKD